MAGRRPKCGDLGICATGASDVHISFSPMSHKAERLGKLRASVAGECLCHKGPEEMADLALEFHHHPWDLGLVDGGHLREDPPQLLGPSLEEPVPGNAFMLSEVRVDKGRIDVPGLAFLPFFKGRHALCSRLFQDCLLEFFPQRSPPGHL